MIPKLRRDSLKQRSKLANQHPVQIRAELRSHLASLAAIALFALAWWIDWPWYILTLLLISAVSCSWLGVWRTIRMRKARERGDCPNCYYSIMGGQTTCPECGLDLQERVGEANVRRHTRIRIAGIAAFMLTFMGVQFAPMLFNWGMFDDEKSSYEKFGPGVRFQERWLLVMDARYPHENRGGDQALRDRMWTEVKAALKDDLPRLIAEANALYGMDHDLKAIDRYVHEGLLECNEIWRDHWNWYDSHRAE